tara:strand:- start:268 stop:528 length:261 start_codon:yes stop_codon:yes gene_type:complete
MKCSFEETVNVLADAAINSEVDNLKGVTENIIMGKISNIGTGNFNLLLDEKKFKNVDNGNKRFKLKEVRYANEHTTFEPSTPVLNT